MPKLIFEQGSKGRSTDYTARTTDMRSVKNMVPAHMMRTDLCLPFLGELDVVRHYTQLSRLNFSLDANFYPLGSCTMKYNPKCNEEAAAFAGFSRIHPLQNEKHVQGALELLWHLSKSLEAITGCKSVSLLPSSGAQAELCGVSMIRKYHRRNGQDHIRTKVIVPDSAHGTNPATAAMCGYQIVVAPSKPDGLIDIEILRGLVDEHTAAIMLTNPNTLGLFEKDILAISQMVHDAGGLLYYDGANFNALLGITQPVLMGFDVIHLNLHKTFSTPHGCGGPGVGALGVGERLVEYMPVPLVGVKKGKYFFDYMVRHSIGKVRAFYGNFSILVRAYAYIVRLGRQGLTDVARHAVLNANYVLARLSDIYQVGSNRCMHEVVISCIRQKERGASALEIAKRLIDYGIHPPTMYFPLIVKEALMIEPTETESKETLDEYIRIMRLIDTEISDMPECVRVAPAAMPVTRVDEVRAARQLDLCYKYMKDEA